MQLVFHKLRFGLVRHKQPLHLDNIIQLVASDCPKILQPESIFKRRIWSIALRDVELLEFDEELARLENHILILEQKLADLEK